MPDENEKDFGLGDIIEGNLRLTEIIGEGATGQVFLAEDVNLTAKKYAVKRLDKEQMEPIDFEDYKREIIFMKKLSGHPNIVQYINNFETVNFFYLVLEYCETDLFDAIFLRCGFPVALVKRFFSDIANGLAHCHQNGIYHRDIKPENVLITADGGQAKLADFGLATMDKYSDEFGVGSIRYLAPECLGPSDDGEANDIDCYCTPAADVWALGVLLLNMIFGRNPWHEASFSDPVFHSYINVDPAILKKNLKITDHLDHFLRHKVFNMDPDNRCSVSDFGEFVSSQKQFVDTNDDDASSIQVEFVENGDKINIIHKFVKDPPSSGSTPTGSQVFKPRRMSIPENNFDESFASNLNASIVAHIGSIDGFGNLQMSSADVSSPFIESKESRVNLVKKMGFSSVTSMDRISSQRIKKKNDRNNSRKKNLA